LPGRRCPWWGGPAATGPSADPREQLLARLREHVLADVLAGHSLDEVDDWLEGVEGLGREERGVVALRLGERGGLSPPSLGGIRTRSRLGPRRR
jgi:hypothetical protein